VHGLNSRGGTFKFIEPPYPDVPLFYRARRVFLDDVSVAGFQLPQPDFTDDEAEEIANLFPEVGITRPFGSWLTPAERMRKH
jgi:hypothetical protein